MLGSKKNAGIKTNPAIKKKCWDQNKSRDRKLTRPLAIVKNC